MEKILIGDKKKFEEKLRILKSGGAASLHVITDFDRTLTKVYSKKEGASTSYDAIDRVLGPDFFKKSKEMADFYYPIETSNDLSREFKFRKMIEWWRKYYSYAIRHGMRKNLINEAIKNNPPRLRPKAISFLCALTNKKIPLLIFSAGNGNVIEAHLNNEKLLSKNVHILSNFFIFDKKGKAVGFNKPQIHVFNKNESCIRNNNYKKQIAGRKNVMLLGDSLGDITMADGLEHECVVKIGFYNHKHDDIKKIKKYRESYDAIIMDNGSFDYINKIFKEITG